MPSGPWEDFAAPATSQGEEGPWQDFASTSKIGALSTSTDPLSRESLEAENKAQFVSDLKANARKQVNNAVGLVDMGLSTIIGMPLTAAVDTGGRGGRLLVGGTRKEAEEEGARNTQNPTVQAFNTPVASFMKGLGWGDDFDQSDVSNVMGGLMKAIESGGEWFNEKTGGIISKADTVSAFNILMMGFGGRAAATLDPKIKAIGDPKLPKIKDPFAESQTPQADAFKAKVDARAAEFAKQEAAAKQKDGTGTPEEATAAWDNWARAYTEEASGTAPKAEVPPSPGVDPVAPPTKAEGPGSMRGSSLLLPAAIAATGLGLAYQFGDQKDLVSAAIGGGIVLAGRGKGIDLARLEILPDTTPLGIIRDQMGYTFATLERLPAGRPTISRQLITEQLKRQDITAAEKGVFEDALKMLPEGDVSAKQLVGALKVVADDWELKKVDSDSFADYGLEAIDRTTVDSSFNTETGRYNRQDIPSSTHIYQLPNISLGKNNHFNDPNYFGHTRVFWEGGKRHVVEIQSDLAQKAGKVLTEGERTALQKDYEAAVTFRQLAEKELTKVEQTGEDLYGNSTSVPAARYDLQRAFTREAELSAKLAESSSTAAVSPLLKNWHKRLVREELADAARGKPELLAHAEAVRANMGTAAERGLNPTDLAKQMDDLEASARPEPVVRFATADTVAKVEGWPEKTTPMDTARELNMDYAAWKAATEGTTRFSPEHQGIYDRYKGDVEKFLRQLGGKPVTDSAGHTWIEVPVEGSKTTPAGSRAQMFGGIDPKVAGVMAAMGISAWLASSLSDDHKGYSAAATAAAVGLIGLTSLAKSKSRGVAHVAKDALDTVEDWAGNMSYQLEKLSPPILRSQRNFERLLMTSTQHRLHRTAPWIEGLRHIHGETANQLAAALLSGSRTAVDNILVASGQTKLRPALAEVTKVLAEVGAELKEMKLLKNLVPDYYPRIVADYPGLLEALGSEGKQFVEGKLAEAEARSVKKTGEGLTELERSAILNQSLQDSIFVRGGEGRRFLKNRTVAQVTEQLAPFYEPPADTLPIYLRAATNAIEKARFFGKNLVLDPATGKINNNASIGNVVNEQVQAGKLSLEGRQEVERLMKARFGPGEQTTTRALRALQNFTTATLVANPVTAMMNLQDIGTIATMQGVLPMIKGVSASILRRDGRITTADLGLADVIAEEFTGASRNPVTVMGRQLSAARFLDKMMKYSGFKALDLLMKEGHFNAAETAVQKRLASSRGEQQFAARNAEYFGKDLPQLISDLRSGERSALAYEYFWREVSDAQPLSKTEMPTANLENPKLRLLWQIRSFMIKQITLMRQRGIDEIRRGNVKDGTAFLLRYALFVGTAGAGMEFITNSILGKDNELEWGDIPMNAFKNFGASQYIMEKARDGKLKDAAASLFSPAMGSLLDIFTGGEKAVGKIPVVGRIIYNRALGGAEESDMKKWERDQKAKRAEERDADLTDSDREDREEKAREKKERRLERYRDRETQP